MGILDNLFGSGEDSAQTQVNNSYKAVFDSLSRSQAVIEFEPDGTIITANDNFCNAMGYHLSEIQGQHHRMFAEPGYANSDEYRQFWARLGRGEFDAGEYKRLGKGGKEIWIQASYNPVFDELGTVVKVVKFATDITATKLAAADSAGQLDAISKSQAVIQFNLDGTIITANDNFCNAMGYTLGEIQGQHHSMFAPAGVAESAEYKAFWEKLGRGEYDAGEYQRVGKGGKEIWISASYNPIYDMNGKPFKVVKYATDITAQKMAEVENRKTADMANALNVCQANVMIADNDLNIIFVNEENMKMLKSHEEKLRSVLPAFEADKLVGTCVDVFHKNPAHQRTMLKNLSEPYHTKLKVSDLTFSLIATPWYDVDGERCGTIVEWNDLTEELAKAEAERAVAAENARTRSALDVCQANVMMADANFDIVYVNHAVVDMLRGNQAKLREVLPNFNAETLVGTSIDTFHKDPSHQRRMLEKLTTTYKTQLELVGLNFNLIATPVFDTDGDRIGTVVEWQDVTEQLAREKEERRVANENARVKQALDNVNTNVMIGNANHEVIYMNEAIHGMMRNAEADIKAVLPNFDANNLLGQNMDIFHKNPAHQRGMVDKLTSTYSTEIQVGKRTFSLVASPIVAEDGKRIGTVVEWNDRTGEVAIEKEIDDLVDAAAAGDLSNRIVEEGKGGFFLGLAKGLNKLVSISEGVIEETATTLDALAHGNLTQKINSDYDGLFDKLKRDANSTVDKLTEVIGRINNSANMVTSGAEEIAQGNADLSQRTEEQASSLEETASSMEEMTSTVRQNADNAKVANDLAAEAAQKAQLGGEVVGKAVESMEEINDSSKKINDIIGVIDEIAFQTNLLALNAAVEAARAGEQGRGFAVVAGEVRNLAQRSAAAAKEIKELIRDSVTKVEDGTSLVNQSGETLQEIVDSVVKVNQMIADISDASEEQSSGIEQVNKAITQMDEMTQQNAALVEEASAAGESMAEQARAMKQLLSFFSVQQGAASGGQQDTIFESSPASFTPQSSSGQQIQSYKPAEGAGSDDDDWEEF